VLLAVAVLEVALHPFATGLRNDWQRVPVAVDPDTGQATEVRQYHEGISVSHFSPAHARLTGATWVPGAPVGVVLGDSYIEAKQIGDSETIGAVVERAARQSGAPLNVRQYGWSGASVPQYLAVAPYILKRWNPRWVAITLNEGDLRSLAGVSPDTTAPFKVPAPTQTFGTDAFASAAARAQASPLRSLPQAVTSRSAVAYELLLRSLEIVGTGTGDADGGGAAPLPVVGVQFGARHVVRALHRAYGSRVAVLYVATLRPGEDAPDTLGAALLSACTAEGIACASTHDGMHRELERHSRFARGFLNGPPASGHPNAVGHRVMGETLWSVVCAATNNGGRIADVSQTNASTTQAGSPDGDEETPAAQRAPVARRTP